MADELRTDRAVFLISGIPGAGKSTVASLLAQRFDRGVHIDADVVRAMTVSGNAWAPWRPPAHPRFEQDLGEEAERQLRLRARNTSLLADSFFAADYTVALDEIAIGERLDDFRADIKGRPLLLVNLAPSLDVVERRDAGRAGEKVFETWAYLDEVMRRYQRGVGLWLDTSELTPEQTVDEVLRRAWDEGALQ